MGDGREMEMKLNDLAKLYSEAAIGFHLLQ